MNLFSLPAFTDNYIWLLRDTEGRALIVDPGQAEPVFDALVDAPTPHAICITHHHGDHLGGVAALKQRWPDIPVFAPEDTRIPFAEHRVHDGQNIHIGPWTFTVLAVPGHTQSHVAYVGEGLLFCGDALFSLGCGRMFEGTPTQMHASLQRLAALPASTLLCCAHEYTQSNARFAQMIEPQNPALAARIAEIAVLRSQGQPTLPVSLASEIACNPFLRCQHASVRAAARAYAGQPLNDDIAVFAALRAWKDDFRG